MFWFLGVDSQLSPVHTYERATWAPQSDSRRVVFVVMFSRAYWKGFGFRVQGLGFSRDKTLGKLIQRKF